MLRGYLLGMSGSSPFIFPLAILAAIALGVVFGIGYLESRKEELSGKASWLTYALIFFSICGYTAAYWLSEAHPVAGDFVAISLGLFIGGYAVVLGFQVVHRWRLARRKSRQDQHS